MDPAAEAQRLRIADELARDDATRPADPGPGGAPALLCQTTTAGTYPTTARVYYALQALDAGGAETEGGSGTTSARPGTFYALNLGNAVPPAAAQVVATFVSYRWVFRYD